jgi:chorismate synthase
MGADNCSMVMQQNARSAAAALLPRLTHLPPTMVLPGKDTVEKIRRGEEVVQVQNQKSGEE